MRKTSASIWRSFSSYSHIFGGASPRSCSFVVQNVDTLAHRGIIYIHIYIGLRSHFGSRAQIACARQEYCRPQHPPYGLEGHPVQGGHVEHRCGDGLEDTLAHFTVAAGFKKTPAFQLRGIKQSRGSSGEGVWITTRVGGHARIRR